MARKGTTMRRIIYTSDASPLMTDEKVAAIAEKSRRKNGSMGLTGALSFDKGRFLQLLEGPSEAVTARFEAIRRDARHQNIQIICDVPTNMRNFPNKPMALMLPGEVSEDMHEALSALFDLADEPVAPSRQTLGDLLPRFSELDAA